MGLITEDFHTVFGRGSEKKIKGQEVQMALWLAVQELTIDNEELQAKVAEFDEMKSKMSQFESVLLKLTTVRSAVGNSSGFVVME